MNNSSKSDFNQFSIVFTGIGGQGLISIIRILGESFLLQNFEVITAETHGLGQRGGKVNTFLRFGNKPQAPLPLFGSADMIVASEKSAVLDVLRYSKPDKTTKFIISTYEKKIVDVEYPNEEYIQEQVKKKSDFISYIPSNNLAQNLIGNTRTENTILIGYMLRFLPLEREDIEAILKKNFSGMILEQNIKALEEGINYE
jgi:indolepyruvate ferredoxin oxidoreductase beta subunit